MTIDVHDNNLTKMIMGQEYDTESAHMIFDEENIDWKIMNIKMTIDKSGKQHPSWVYTPLYTKESISISQPIPTGDEDTVVVGGGIDIDANAGGVFDGEDIGGAVDINGGVDLGGGGDVDVGGDVVVGGDVDPGADVDVDVDGSADAGTVTTVVKGGDAAVDAEGDGSIGGDVDVIDNSADIVAIANDEKIDDIKALDAEKQEVAPDVAPVVFVKDYETQEFDEEFDVELGDWKVNESFRLIFDPTGSIKPRIEFRVGDTSVDVPPTNAEPAKPPTPEVEVETVVVETVEPVEPEPEEPPKVTPPKAGYNIVVEPTHPSDDDEDDYENIPGEGDATDTKTDTETIVDPPADQIVGGSVAAEVETPTVNLPISTTFVLPDIRNYGKGLADFIRDELIDIHMLQVLTTNGGINWWADIKGCCKLFPLWILNQDGGSLLFAINFAIFGLRNYVSHLQTAFYNMLSNPVIDTSIKQKWSYNLWLKNSTSNVPIPSASEIDEKWNALTRGGLYDFLSGNKEKGFLQIDPIHLYMLANLLARPIIILSEVVSEVNQTSLKGIYMPFEHNPEKCCHFPIILGYHRQRFNALVATDTRVNTLAHNNSQQIWVPISDAFLSLLPIHFPSAPGASWVAEEILDPLKVPSLTNDDVIEELIKYVNLVKVRFSKATYNPPVDDKVEEATEATEEPAAESDPNKGFNFLTAIQTNLNRKPHDYKEMIKEYKDGAKRRHKSMKRQKLVCKNNGCKNIPSSQLNGYCVKCYQRTLLGPREEQST